MTEVLNRNDYEKILKCRFNDPNIKFLQAKVKPISESIQGFMGEHYQIIITYERNGDEQIEPFFMKTLPKNDLQAKFPKENKIFQKEIFQYDILHKEFKKYGYDTSFASPSFHVIPNQTIIMHDMTKLGYHLHERLKCYDVDHLKCLLKSLALYHGAGFAYEQIKSKELGYCFTLEQKWPEPLREFFYANLSSSVKEMWDGYIQSYDELIDLLPESESYRKDFQHLLRSYNMLKPFSKETKLAKTCGHGDLWSNNMLFKYENNIPVTCCLIDFQMGRYIYPIFDVLLAIYSNTNSKFRTKHLTVMYQYYYDTLTEIVRNYGYSLKDIMPSKHFYDSIKLMKVNAMLHVLLTFCIIYLPTTTITSITEKSENILALKDKAAVIVHAFKTDKKFYKAVSDALYDLHEALIEYYQ